MSASGTFFLQTFVFLLEARIFKVCQEIGDLLAHGRRRESPASGPSKTLSATVAGAWPDTNKSATGSPCDRKQVRSCTAGETTPLRRAVRNPQTHAKTCQTIQKHPVTRIQTVAAAHAEGRNAVIITTMNPNAAVQTDEIPMAASPAESGAKVAGPMAAKAPVPAQAQAQAQAQASPSAARCPLPSSSLGGRNC